MRRDTVLTVAVAVLAAAVVGLAVALAIVSNQLSSTQSQLRSEQRSLKATQALILTVQTQQAASQKASTETRITTVSQRCDLTRRIWRMSLDVEPAQSQDLYFSLLGCEGQLLVVKAIDAATPAPRAARQKTPAR